MVRQTLNPDKDRKQIVKASNPLLSNTSAVGRDAAAHRYAVGQNVRLKGNFTHQPASASLYRITSTLPPAEASPQYRIRNDVDGHERVAPEESLEPAREGSPLIDETFGHREESGKVGSGFPLGG